MPTPKKVFALLPAERALFLATLSEVERANQSEAGGWGYPCRAALEGAREVLSNGGDFDLEAFFSEGKRRSFDCSMGDLDEVFTDVTEKLEDGTTDAAHSLGAWLSRTFNF